MIFLNIIKVIGIIILVIILLLILILAAILYLPIRYRIESRNMEVSGRASWIGLIRIRFSYSRQKETAAIGKALWIPFFEHPSSPDQAPTIKGSNKKSSNKKDSNNKESNEKESNEKELNEKELNEKESNKDNYDFDVKNVASKSRHSKKKRKKTGKFKKIKMQIQKWIHVFQSNRSALRKCKQTLFHIIKVILPKKIRIEGTYSLGSPDKTAQALGIAACFPIGYRNNWKIYPDFDVEEAYFDGYIDIRGRIYLYQIVFPLLRLLFDKECKKLYKAVK
ncbi:MAG: hypothetical protein K6G13_08050 [Agathobacter sp.]|uniref:hypothetical protein n=1 Tax=Agathobacter sp. TaxID=2021311 RepID=UPI002588BAB6|nr:hypothetical protein [Agathobacter sp.]MCR5677965.1 hypothetical protein [Agathobacter sp.]